MSTELRRTLTKKDIADFRERKTWGTIIGTVLGGTMMSLAIGYFEEHLDFFQTAIASAPVFAATVYAVRSFYRLRCPSCRNILSPMTDLDICPKCDAILSEGRNDEVKSQLNLKSSIRTDPSMNIPNPDSNEQNHPKV